MWFLGASHGDPRLLQSDYRGTACDRRPWTSRFDLCTTGSMLAFFKEAYFYCFKLHVSTVCVRNVHAAEGQTPEIRASGSCEPTSVGAGPEASAGAAEALSY